MSRLAFRLLMVGALVSGVGAAEPADTDAGLKNTLALQTAMGHARHFLLNHNAKKAVEVLEEQLPRVNGNRTYLQLLGEAYRAYIRELGLAHQDGLAKRYLERLCILEPAAASDPSLQPLPERKPVEPPPAAPKPATVFPNWKINNPFARAAAAEPTARPATVRAKTDEGEDPFDLRLRRSSAALPSKDRAAPLVARAEEEFSHKRYAEARGYYEQAYQADPASIADCRDRWGYCLLYYVDSQLRQPGQGGRPAAELLQQVQTAVTLAPQLAGAASRLQQEIERSGRGQQVAASLAPAVVHRGRNREGWQVAETAHFRIFHRQDNALAERVAQIAERTRQEMSRKWLGSDAASWGAPCELILHPDAASYSGMTGQPGSSPGHSRIESDAGRVIGRRLDLRLDHAGALECVLPHEATHVVLAGQLGPFSVPRWADEGIAVLSEPADRLEQHRRNLQKFHGEGLLFGARELMEMDEYPPARRIGAFYAQSVALVEFLAAQKGPQTFTEFLRDALRQGYPSALQKHYGWDFPQLEQQWQQQVLGGASRVAAGR